MSQHIRSSFLVLTLLLVFIGTSLAQQDYTGQLKIFIVEPTSRWSDAYGFSYGFGFLDFGMETMVDVKESGAWEQTSTWVANAAGFEGVTESNIASIAVLTDDTAITEDAYPPYGFFFDAYYVDAAVMTTPGQASVHQPTGGFTHTVFIEQGGTSG